jgi:hypothetical protein
MKSISEWREILIDDLEKFEANFPFQYANSNLLASVKVYLSAFLAEEAEHWASDGTKKISGRFVASFRVTKFPRSIGSKLFDSAPLRSDLLEIEVDFENDFFETFEPISKGLIQS